MVKVYPISTTTTVFSYSIINPIYKEADIAQAEKVKFTKKIIPIHITPGTGAPKK